MARRREHYRGLGERISARLVDLGFSRDNGGPDVRGFCRIAQANGHFVEPSSLYSWIADDTKPDQENLTLLSRVLGVTCGFLLFGEERAPAALAKTWKRDAAAPKGRKRP